MTFDPHAFADPADNKAALRRLLQAGSRLYMQFARETLARFGTNGEATVRQHLRQYGVWRGTEMREAHNALGLPLDMETLNRCWDSASVFIVKSDLESKGKYTACDVQYEVHDCPAADVWRAEDFHRWGHVYCDEFHQACASTYHPDGDVVIPINMMKGDDHCAFRWIMPANAASLDLGEPTELGRRLARTYVADTAEQGAVNAMLRTSRLVGGCYLTMTRPLFARHPATAAETRSRFLRVWAEERGRRLRERHRERGIAPTPANFVREMDFCVRYAWDVDERVDAPDRYEAGVAWTPMDQAWIDYDEADAARAFWEVSYPALARGYDDRFDLTVPSLTWRGDRETVLRVARV